VLWCLVISYRDANDSSSGICRRCPDGSNRGAIASVSTGMETPLVQPSQAPARSLLMTYIRFFLSEGKLRVARAPGVSRLLISHAQVPIRPIRVPAPVTAWSCRPAVARFIRLYLWIVNAVRRSWQFRFSSCEPTAIALLDFVRRRTNWEIGIGNQLREGDRELRGGS